VTYLVMHRGGWGYNRRVVAHYLTEGAAVRHALLAQDFEDQTGDLDTTPNPYNAGLPVEGFRFYVLPLPGPLAEPPPIQHTSTDKTLQERP